MRRCFARWARTRSRCGPPRSSRDLDGLVIPGGESTTIAKAIERDGLEPAIRAHAGSGRPILGTCAGMIICDREHLGLVDATARRNAFGRQIASFELELQVGGLGPDPMRAVFIRAPWIEDHGAEVEVLASVDGHPVVVRQGRIVLCAFHPELTDDSRLHALLMALATSARERLGERPATGDEQRAVRDPRVDSLARILVHYSTEVTEGETCLIEGPSAGEPLIAAVYEEVLKAGGHPVVAISIEGQTATFFKHASDAQLEWVSPLARVGGRRVGLPDRDRRRDQHPRAVRRSPGAPIAGAARRPAT